MKLINCQTYELNEFFGSEIPAYVILSHTWAEEEVTHNDFISPSGTWRSKKGAQKIIQTCQLGQEHQIQWAWVDTCCIDKSSSAELNEAINSMFEWYRQARVCYIWLSDYDSSSGDLSACKWFTRGWTLQELIASNKRLFYDQDWKCFGAAIRAAPNNTESISPSLVGRNLMQELSEITRIPLDVLHRDLDFAMMKYAVCQKMSWASSRKTTRVEDMAYCLLGMSNPASLCCQAHVTSRYLRYQHAHVIRRGRPIFPAPAVRDHERIQRSQHPRLGSPCDRLQRLARQDDIVQDLTRTFAQLLC